MHPCVMFGCGSSGTTQNELICGPSDQIVPAMTCDPERTLTRSLGDQSAAIGVPETGPGQPAVRGRDLVLQVV